jgi:hypothetical protein
VPAQDHLGRRLAVRLRDRGDARVGEHVAAARERAPGLGDDAVPLVELAQRGLGEVRVQLHLVDGGHGARLVDQPLQVRDLEVRHPDRARPTVARDLLQRAPRVDVAVALRQRPVDEVEVDVVEPEPLQALVERRKGGVVALVGVPHLGGDEHLVTRHTALRDGRADLVFVLVELRGVDVAVAGGQRGGHRRLGFARRHQEHPEAQLGDGDAVVQLDRGHCAHAG